MNKFSTVLCATATLVVCFYSVHARAVIGADPTADAAALTDAYPEVVKLQSPTEVCTGTIIGPRAILSAAHCADLKASFIEHRGRRYKLTYVRSAAYASHEHDVAIAITDTEIAGARFAHIGEGLRHGREITLAGFGCTARGGPSGPLHLGRTKVIGMDQDHVLSTAPKGGVLCSGDSGGPAFVREGGRNVVVAVNSAGDLSNINLNVRLDSPASRGFLRAVASRFKLAICGVTKTCDQGRLIASRD